MASDVAPKAPPVFDEGFRDRLRDLLVWRRDVRRFRTDPLPSDTALRLIESARLAPSVGLSEPWRFATVSDPERRRAVRENFRTANENALAGYSGEKAQLYATLKLSGMDQAPLQIAVFTDETSEQGSGLGRATMPETFAYSAVAAIHAMWLTARAEGIGIGWVSILNPAEIPAILDTPSDWRFIAYLCIGYPEIDSSSPALEEAGWERRRPTMDFVIER
ncbi:MAG: 5,6-dimethylbenzimidazole synthase [Pseudomonadota bacterium]|jgi:5,6-dimethylbenzimidazole synthase|nr:5,6-dimethylbenzimidazole synthase [Rhodospirillaceae bacterium]MEC7397142.1 5,6-dimethylbenzimidazole synthase [Pseudomonadota bacterium]MEC8200352.1 5,6-dimethylbenzimidazole synthase [Pseudomonadota bacterium]